MSNEHVIEAMGRTRVVLRNGKVVEVSKPKIKSCPFMETIRSDGVYSRSC